MIILPAAVVLSVSGSLYGQTNVFDDVIAPSPNHTYLEAALIQENLDVALQDTSSSFTVFAPTDEAFDTLAVRLGTDISGLLSLPNLDEILLYHVLGVSVPSSAVNNGDIVTPLDTTNTLKLTKKSNGDVFINHSQVTTPDLNTDNGIVHVVNEVLLPNETVVDIAIDNGFSTLATAVITAELLPSLTDPHAAFTVFAPTNNAFDDLATALNTDLNGILALPNLSDILLYHVVAGTVLSTDLSNGTVTTLSGDDITVDLSSGVMINDAMVTMADVTADNGVVHVIDKVLLAPTTGIGEKTRLDIEIYPNPTTDQLVVDALNGRFEIYSHSGYFLSGGTLNNGTVNVSSLTPGAYILRVQEADGFRTARFVKN
jgi:transforming growth factor-beta-induced protein